ncbi:MAG: class I SAM-dependent methyltransferase [Pyrinomonadaceae bacterium]
MSPAPSTDDAQGADERLRAEFNDWVRAGRGPSMERGHRPVGEQAIRLLEIPDDGRVLDVGCGNGWATRLMAQDAAHGRVVGIDISDEMVDLSRETEVLPNVEFREASAERLPFAENEFTHAFSMESLYYYGDILRALQEIWRVLKPGGRFACVVDLYKENRPSHQWIPDLKVPVHLLSIDEYRSQFEAAGFVNVSDQRVYDPTPVPEDYAGGSFKTREDFLEYRATGSLLIMGEVAE